MPHEISPENLKALLPNWSLGLQSMAQEMNSLDALLGDGDLGTTLARCGVNMQEALPSMPDTLEGIFKVLAQSCAKASGSSFGTLLAVGFLTAAKSVGERSTMNRELMASILQAVVAALSSRGGAKLGDKTMLDSLEAIRKVLAAGEGQSDLQKLACDAALDALDLLRNNPNRIGRASMFSERSVGMDDPGMVAVWRMTQNLAV